MVIDGMYSEEYSSLEHLSRQAHQNDWWAYQLISVPFPAASLAQNCTPWGIHFVYVAHVAATRKCRRYVPTRPMSRDTRNRWHMATFVVTCHQMSRHVVKCLVMSRCRHRNVFLALTCHDDTWWHVRKTWHWQPQTTSRVATCAT
jgi:hypothetical protein